MCDTLGETDAIHREYSHYSLYIYSSLVYDVFPPFAPYMLPL